ncbi:MAG: hypothetical protein Q8L36_01560 [bacterium]|nr:hypothetical protein [bacterium]
MTVQWTEVIIGSFQNLWISSVSVLGNIIGALIIFIVGLIIASGLSLLVEKIIGMLKLDSALRKLGVAEYFERAGLNLNSGRFFGRLVYWFFVVVFLLAASDILRFYALSSFLQAVVIYLPNVFIAALIMLAAVVIANVLRRLIRSSVKSAQLHSANFLGSLAWWAVSIFGFLAALSQLGIAVSIINALVTGLVAMLALAGGIAFGLGGKDYAASLLNKMRDNLGH